MKVAITAHRPASLGGIYHYDVEPWTGIKNWLRSTYTKYGVTKVYTGMALGGDTVAALVARELTVPYVACVPFKGQEYKWPKHSQDLYNELLDYAELVKYVSEPGYAAWKFHARNHYMVDNADGLLAIWNGKKSGGTYATIEYAKKSGKLINYCPGLRNGTW